MQMRHGFMRLKKTERGKEIFKKLESRKRDWFEVQITEDMINGVTNHTKIKLANNKTDKYPDDPGFPVKSWQRTLWYETYGKLPYSERRDIVSRSIASRRYDLFISNVSSVVIKERAILLDRKNDSSIYLMRETHDICQSLDELSELLHDIVYRVATKYEYEIPGYMNKEKDFDHYEIRAHVKALISMKDGTYLYAFGPIDKLLKILHAYTAFHGNAKNGFTIEYY